MKNKKETILEHWLYLWLSPQYRYQMMLEEGENTWRQLDKALPRAMGNESDDKDRLNLFKKEVQKLTQKKKENLTRWLRNEIYDLKQGLSEQTSSSLEAFEQKWLQIYREHLKALS